MGKRRGRNRQHHARAGQAEAQAQADGDTEPGHHGQGAAQTSEGGAGGAADGVRCHKCRQVGHKSSKCPVRKQRRQEKMKCYVCGKEGHARKDCPGIEDGGSGQSRHRDKGRRKRRDSERAAADRVDLAVGPGDSGDSGSGSGASSDSDDDEYEDGECYDEDYDGAEAVPYVDTCCRLHLLFQEEDHKGDFAAYVRSRRRGAAPIRRKRLLGCVAPFCDAKALLAETGDRSYRSWELFEGDGSGRVHFAFGLQPRDCARYYSAEVQAQLSEYLRHPKAVAMGVIGLDFKAARSAGDRQLQQEALRAQLEAAVDARLPVMLSCRDADMEFAEVLTDTVPSGHRIMLLGGSPRLHFTLRKRYTRLYSAFCGQITFSKAKATLETVFDCPPDRLLLCSNGPFQVPVALADSLDHSHPGVVPHVAAKVAECRRGDVAELMEAAAANARKFFKI